MRDRFLRGLQQGEHLFVTTVLHSAGHAEMVFVSVRGWLDPGVVDGLLDSGPITPGFHDGDVMKVNRGEILDWTISRPDGTEEGNLLGKYQESFSKAAP